MQMIRIAIAAAAVLALTGSAMAADAPPGASSCSGCHPAARVVTTPVPRLMGRDAAQIGIEEQAALAAEYGIDEPRLKAWVKEVCWETLLNRAGTTFRTQPDEDRANVTEKKAIALMIAQPSMIKRPVLDAGGKLIVGFKPAVYAKMFS